MPYTRTTWQDFPDTTTPITAASLNNVEGFLSGDSSDAQWESFTPSWTNVTLGTSATNVGHYAEIGRVVVCRVSLTLGTGASVGGNVRLDWPVAPVSMTSLQPLGNAIYFDTSASAYNHGTMHYINATLAGCYNVRADSTFATATNLSASAPFTWGEGDRIMAQFTYEAAA
jgi:hypothetical protein